MENETVRTDQKKKKIWLWVPVSLIAGLLIGVGIACCFAFLENGTATSQSYQVAQENGYSGNSDQKLVSLVQTDEAIRQVSEQMRGSVVTVVIQKTTQVMGQSSVSRGLGSGVVFREDQNYFYVITNAHVVNGADTIALYFNENQIVTAALVGQDTQSDIAVIKIAKKDTPEDILSGMKCAEFGDSDKLRIGETAIVIGSPQGTQFSYSVTVGVISGTQREVEVDGVPMSLVQTDAAINPGNSGGALLDRDGRVVGITSAKLASDDVEGIGFAIPANTAVQVAETLMANGRVEWLSLGLKEYAFLSEAIADAYHVPTGIIVYETLSGGPAAKANIRRGDIITEINGEKLESAASLQTILAKYKAGDTVTLTVIRNRNTDKPLTVSVVLMTESELAELQQGSGFWGNK